MFIISKYRKSGTSQYECLPNALCASSITTHFTSSLGRILFSRSLWNTWGVAKNILFLNQAVWRALWFTLPIKRKKKNYCINYNLKEIILLLRLNNVEITSWYFMKYLWVQYFLYLEYPLHYDTHQSVEQLGALLVQGTQLFHMDTISKNYTLPQQR